MRLRSRIALIRIERAAWRHAGDVQLGDDRMKLEQCTVNAGGSRLDYTVAVTHPVNPVGSALWGPYWSDDPGTITRPPEYDLD